MARGPMRGPGPRGPKTVERVQIRRNLLEKYFVMSWKI